MRWSWVFVAMMIALIGYTLYYKHNWQKRVDAVAVKIDKWDIDRHGIAYLQITLDPDEPVYYYREISCVLMDKNRQPIKKVTKPIEAELTTKITKIFPIAAAPKGTEYMDCYFRD